MASRTYWENRMIQLYKSQDKDLERVNKRMKKEYERTGAKIDKEVAAYYAKYGEDDVMEYRRLVEQLSETERDLLYKNAAAFAIKYPQYADLMPVRQSIYQLNRLEGLQLSTRQHMLELGAIEQAEFDRALNKAYERGYLNTMKGLENQPAFFRVDNLIMQQTLNSNWINGENYSDRIWANKEKLINSMNNEIRDGFIRGESYRDMQKLLQNRTGVGASDAERLIYTEAAYVSNEANAQAFVDAGIEEYELSAVMDSKTSPMCRTMDGQRFEFSERKVGINAPPFHPMCRTVTIPVENTQVASPQGKYIAQPFDILEISEQNVGNQEVITKAIERTKSVVDDYKESTGVDVLELWREKRFVDKDNPYDDEKAKFIAHLLERNGYDHTPQKLSDTTNLQKLYRGVTDYEDGSVTAGELVQRFKNGAWEGSGATSSVHGRGIYFSPTDDVAIRYGDEVIEAYITKEAKLADDNALQQMKKHFKSNKDEYGEDAEYYEFMTKMNSFTDKQDDVLAILHGYDGIDSGRVVTIFNRGILGVE